ncbi:MAG: hypothetical protein QOD72_1175 [Acidimicrobiaceae bacterium]|nr:hypothetical protein [Acidimicrobiaceae bacterium]
MTWRWLNEHRLGYALVECPPDELDDLLDDLDAVLADPEDPNYTSPMRGTHDHVDRSIALLRHGWVLVFSVYPNGVPPWSEPGLVVRSLDRFPR